MGRSGPSTTSQSPARGGAVGPRVPGSRVRSASAQPRVSVSDAPIIEELREDLSRSPSPEVRSKDASPAPAANLRLNNLPKEQPAPVPTAERAVRGKMLSTTTTSF